MATPSLHNRNSEKLRRKRELIFIVLLVAVLGVLFYIELNFPRLPAAGMPLGSNIIVFALININIILLLLLIFLILRNTLKLLLERRRRIVGFRLRTKLVLAFATLSLVPTLMLFAAATGFIRISLDNWFSAQFEHALDASLEVGRQYYRTLRDDNEMLAAALAEAITRQGLLIGENPQPAQEYITRRHGEYPLDGIGVYGIDNLLPLAAVTREVIAPTLLHQATTTGIPDELPASRIVHLPDGRGLIQGLAPVFSAWQGDKILAVVVTSRLVPAELITRMDTISSKYSSYKQTESMELYIKYSYVLTFVLIAALIIFISMWFGLYLARNITEPLQELALATRRVATGNLDFTIDIVASDELGMLVQSFNEMTEKLRTSTSEREQAHAALQEMNAELEKRRQYIEVILANINAGVISLDRGGRIITTNAAAKRFFDLDGDACRGKPYREVFTPEIIQKIRQFLRTREAGTGIAPESRAIEISLADRGLHLSVAFTGLVNEDQQYIGMLVIVNDLTEMVQAQKAAAWREVARRIAHEIKNPLTPIALSAQRLQRRYAGLVADNDDVLTSCTTTIVKQVDVLKRLVNEFSQFARMPQMAPRPADFNAVIEESLELYRQGHPDIPITFAPDTAVGTITVDADQFKRAMTNLLDNAVSAIRSVTGGGITVTTTLDKTLQIVITEVCDTGVGVNHRDRLRLFEPYFSTKESGTGLGLAIVKSIVQDHRGFIRVRPNQPRGTCIVIELPTAAINT
ncbi:MAG: HAMP domain-containing protein [Deltaproteobacteria bacterium]|nr:HAMP domain-containing protein [Candidatus Anaeroferrophillacea bacterium]